MSEKLVLTAIRSWESWDEMRIELSLIEVMILWSALECLEKFSLEADAAVMHHVDRLMKGVKGFLWSFGGKSSSGQSDSCRLPAIKLFRLVSLPKVGNFPSSKLQKLPISQPAPNQPMIQLSSSWPNLLPFPFQVSPCLSSIKIQLNTRERFSIEFPSPHTTHASRINKINPKCHHIIRRSKRHDSVSRCSLFAFSDEKCFFFANFNWIFVARHRESSSYPRAIWANCLLLCLLIAEWKAKILGRKKSPRRRST